MFDHIGDLFGTYPQIIVILERHVRIVFSSDSCKGICLRKLLYLIECIYNDLRRIKKPCWQLPSQLIVPFRGIFIKFITQYLH